MSRQSVRLQTSRPEQGGFYRDMAIAVAAVAAALFLLNRYQPEPPSPQAPHSSPPPSIPAGGPAASSTLPAAPPLAPSPHPTVAQSAASGSELEDPALGRFREMARSAGVELAAYRRDGDWFVVTIRSTDRARLMGFLDVAQRYGLKNIDVKAGPQYREFMGPQGRLVHEATHRMKF